MTARWLIPTRSPRPVQRRVVFGVLAALAVAVLLGPAAAASDADAGAAGLGGWWSSLSSVNRVLFCIAFFFSALFVWQFVMTLIGLATGGADAELDTGGDADADVGADADAGDVHADFHADVHGDGALEAAHATTISFKLLSIRSIITGGMMFGWAGALYLYNGLPLSTALVYAMAWAIGGALVIALVMYLMRRLQETGNRQLATCVGQPATVYMDIRAGGTGSIRTMVSGAINYVPARAAGGDALKAGTPVRVARLLDATTVEVRKADD